MIFLTRRINVITFYRRVSDLHSPGLLGAYPDVALARPRNCQNVISVEFIFAAVTLAITGNYPAVGGKLQKAIAVGGYPYRAVRRFIDFIAFVSYLPELALTHDVKVCYRLALTVDSDQTALEVSAPAIAPVVGKEARTFRSGIFCNDSQRRINRSVFGGEQAVGFFRRKIPEIVAIVAVQAVERGKPYIAR